MRKSGAIVNIAFLYIAIARVPVTGGTNRDPFLRVSVITNSDIVNRLKLKCEETHAPAQLFSQKYFHRIGASISTSSYASTILLRKAQGASTDLSTMSSEHSTYHDPDITSTTRLPVMKRRDALISRNTSAKLVPTNPSSLSNRTFQRRFAIFGSLCILEDIKKATKNKCPTASSPIVHFEPTHTDIIFDEAGDFEGNDQFQAIIQSFYLDMYQFATTPTHRSIITSTILDELKSSKFKFYVRNYSTAGGYHELDDITALTKIRHQLQGESKR